MMLLVIRIKETKPEQEKHANMETEQRSSAVLLYNNRSAQAGREEGRRTSATLHTAIKQGRSRHVLHAGLRLARSDVHIWPQVRFGGIPLGFTSVGVRVCSPARKSLDYTTSRYEVIITAKAVLRE